MTTVDLAPLAPDAPPPAVDLTALEARIAARTEIVLKSSEFRKGREASWRELDEMVGRVERRGVRALSLEELLRLPILYRAALSSLSVARTIALDRLEHQIAGIEGHDDVMIALDAELLAQEFAVARRMLPIDEAAVESGRIFAQRLELGALPFLMLRFDAVDRLLRKELQRHPVHPAHVR